MNSLENQLMEAIRDSKIEVVKSLIDKGANINYAPTCGKSPLSTAVALGNLPLIKLLLNTRNEGKCNDQEDCFTKQHGDLQLAHSFDDDDDTQNQNNCFGNGKHNLKNFTPVEPHLNLGYYIFVHNEDPGGIGGFCERSVNLDAETPEGMDGLEWDVEVEGEEVEEADDIWSSQYRWYADILDRTGGLVEDEMHGCDVNMQDYTGRTAVHYAVEYNQFEALDYLISTGCKVDVGDIDNLTPLHLAAMRDRQEIAEVLIAKGANVNRKTMDKMAPLHYAAVRGFAEMAALLINGGAAVDALDANDRTPLMLAVTRDHLDVVEVLITYGAKVNIEEIHGYTPLCEAVWNKSVEAASLLLRAGAKLTQSQYLLHYVVLHRHLAMAELLLRHGAYPNLRDDHGDTPLILAVTCSHLDMIKLLLQYEASPNSANSVSGVTPLHKALWLDQHLTLLEETLRLLCGAGVDLDQPGGLPTTPLTTALISGELNSAVSLVRAGADVNRCSDGRCLWQKQQPSNLDLAVAKQADDLAYLIVAAGFDMSKYQVTYPTDFTKVDPETVSGWLTFVKFNPRRLTDLCRIKIRSQMGNKALQLIPALEIPQSLKQFLLFKDIYVKKYPSARENNYANLLM